MGARFHVLRDINTRRPSLKAKVLSLSKDEDKVELVGGVAKQLNECRVAAEGSQSPRRYFPPASL